MRFLLPLLLFSDPPSLPSPLYLSIPPSLSPSALSVSLYLSTLTLSFGKAGRTGRVGLAEPNNNMWLLSHDSAFLLHFGSRQCCENNCFQLIYIHFDPACYCVSVKRGRKWVCVRNENVFVWLTNNEESNNRTETHSYSHTHTQTKYDLFHNPATIQINYWGLIDV